MVVAANRRDDACGLSRAHRCSTEQENRTSAKPCCLKGVTPMTVQATEPTKSFRAADEEFYQAWQNVGNAVLRLQEATERVRQSLADASPQFALHAESRRVLDRLLYLE